VLAFFVLDGINDGFENLAVSVQSGRSFGAAAQYIQITQKCSIFVFVYLWHFNNFNEYPLDCARTQKYYFFAIPADMNPNLLFNVLPQADSTNNYAIQQIRAGLAQHGIAWFTSQQTDGKGQRGKHWESEPGKNLALSLVVEPSKQASNNKYIFNMFIAEACAAFLEHIVEQKVFLKWPNDLFINDRKAGGILIENIIRGKDWQWSVVGIGLNLNQTSFSPSAGRPLSLTQLTGKYHDPEATARELHSHLLTVIPNFLNGNIEDVLLAYNNRLFRKNDMATFKKADEVFSGIILGVNQEGFLMVETGGVINTIQFGEVEWLFT